MAVNKMRSSLEDEPVEEKDCCSKGGRGKKVVCALIIILAVSAIGYAAFWGGVAKLSSDSLAGVSSKDWQAIFLSNGQVYFGKVNAVGRKTLTLSDIYYLQVVTKPLQQTQVSDTNAAASGQQELTLIKLGNEIHGPTDRMVINLDQVLLTEKLKTDSRVVQAISKYVSDQTKK